MKPILVVLGVFAVMISLSAGDRMFPEQEYTDAFCASVGGKADKQSNYTRAGTYSDCITEDKVYELDFDSKMYECVAQARHYMRVTNRQGVCIAIMEYDSQYAWKRIHRAEDDEWMLPREYRIPIEVITPEILEEP